METAVDEITEYFDARYVTAPEACWRIFNYPLHDKSHAVERLPVHLRNEQAIHFHQGYEAQAVESSLERRTKLVAWHALNQQEFLAAHAMHAEGRGTCEHGYDAATHSYVWPCRDLTYVDMPNHYVCVSDGTRWKKRQRATRGGQVVSRMFQVSQKKNLELYALRLLLLHTTGGDLFRSVSAEQRNGEWQIFSSHATHMKTTVDVWFLLRAHGDHVCDSLQEAARLAGLVPNENELEFILAEMLLTRCSTATMCDFSPFY